MHVCLLAGKRALAGGDGAGGDRGERDGDHGRHHVGVGEAEGRVGVRGMACHAHPCG